MVGTKPDQKLLATGAQGLLNAAWATRVVLGPELEHDRVARGRSDIVGLEDEIARLGANSNDVFDSICGARKGHREQNGEAHNALLCV